MLNTIERGDYAFKIELQDAYFHVLIHPDSRKYPGTYVLPSKLRYIPSRATTLRTEHCLSGIYSSGTQSGSLPPSSRDIGNPISRRLVITPPRPSSLLCHQSQLLQTLDLVGLKLKEAKSELDPVQDIQFLGLRLCLDQGRASLPISKAREITACEYMPNILPDSFVMQRGVPVHGITQLGLWSHPTGSTTHEALTKILSFIRSDKPVYSTVSIRPFSPCHPTQASLFSRMPLPRAGVSTWKIPISRVFGPVQNAGSTSIFWSSGR